ncbi:hypothetical protein [Holzapfeliella sp. JNUCC 72]
MNIEELNVKLKVGANSKREPLINLKGIKKLFYKFVTSSTEGYEYAGGFLTIAEEGLFFKPHFLNFHRDVQFIKSSDIVTVTEDPKISKMITVTTDNNSYIFIVFKRKEVKSLIDEMINQK